MVCLDLDDSEEYIFNLIKEEGYTRYPVCGKDKDDLQAVIQMLKQLDIPVELQFVNFRS